MLHREERAASGTTVHQRHQVEPPALSLPLYLSLSHPIFRKTNIRSKRKRLHYFCYHFQTAIFQAKTNLWTLVYDAWTCLGTRCVHLFIDVHVFTHAGLAHGESYSVRNTAASGSKALAARLSSLPQLKMYLAG